LVIEDAASGIEAGIRAGMMTVGLGPIDRVNAANLVLPNLDDIRWSEMLAQLPVMEVAVPPKLTVQLLTQQQTVQRSGG
jgi:beta-phosphoglucomutase-like phosphatase (HAD superfamily)